MGTRSLTIIKDERREVAVMYRQYDGYLAGHGRELAEFLAGYKVVNGLPVPLPEGKIANGAGDLAAQMVAHFKTEAGGVYLEPAGQRDMGEDYVYTVDAVAGEPVLIAVEDVYGHELIFDGTAQEFLVFLEQVAVS